MPTTAPRVLLVSAVVLINEQTEILLAQRPEGKALAGLWEFPGGKVHADEIPEQALVRELAEELGITVQTPDLSPLTFASHTYESFHLLMPLFSCRRWQGEVQGLEGQEVAWVALGKLDSYPMPPADIPLVPLLQQGLLLDHCE